MLDLKRCVLEPEALREHALQLEANPVAVRARLDEDVRGKRREAVGHRPNVQVVRLDDPVVLNDRAADLGRRSR